MEMDEVGVRVVAGGFAPLDFRVGLLVGHSGVNAFENLSLREPGIFQAADLGAGERGHALQMAVEQKLHGGIRKTDEPEHDRFIADGIEMIDAGDVQNLRLGVSGSREAGNRIRAIENVLVLVGDADERNADFVGEAGVLEFYDLRNLIVGNV